MPRAIQGQCEGPRLHKRGGSRLPAAYPRRRSTCPEQPENNVMGPGGFRRGFPFSLFFFLRPRDFVIGAARSCRQLVSDVEVHSPSNSKKWERPRGFHKVRRSRLPAACMRGRSTCPEQQKQCERPRGISCREMLEATGAMEKYMLQPSQQQ